MSTEQFLWPRTFICPGGLHFEISVPAWTLMQCSRQNEPHMAEAGGVLLGRHLRDGSAIIVDAITTPLLDDQRSRARFFRAQSRHQAVIDEAWHASNGTCTYLGEWHTHPEPIPTPSTIDWADWQRRLRSDRFSEPIFFVIVGIPGVAAWEGNRSGVLKQLSLIER